MTYQPKIGDRVRASLVYEGVVRGLPAHSHEGVHVRVELDAPTAADPMDLQRYLDERVWEFEKLADPVPPEPVWVNGDVVRVLLTGGLFVRAGGAWRHAESNQYQPGRRLSDRWSEGNLEILYKAGQPAGKVGA